VGEGERVSWLPLSGFKARENGRSLSPGPAAYAREDRVSGSRDGSRPLDDMRGKALALKYLTENDLPAIKSPRPAPRFGTRLAYNEDRGPK
jgi:hypothetical protein